MKILRVFLCFTFLFGIVGCSSSSAEADQDETTEEEDDYVVYDDSNVSDFIDNYEAAYNLIEAVNDSFINVLDSAGTYIDPDFPTFQQIILTDDGTILATYFAGGNISVTYNYDAMTFDMVSLTATSFNYDDNYNALLATSVMYCNYNEISDDIGIQIVNAFQAGEEMHEFLDETDYFLTLDILADSTMYSISTYKN